jgi:hypothetical protein
MAKEGTGSFVIPAHDKKRRIIHDDKSEFFNKDMRPTLMFVLWIDVCWELKKNETERRGNKIYSFYES